VDPWSTSALFFCLLLILPLLALFPGWIQTGEWWSHIREELLSGYIWETVTLVLTVGILSFLMAVPSAWLVTHFDFPGRKALEWAMVLPLAIPSYVAAFVYMDVKDGLDPLLILIREHAGVETYLFAEVFIRKGILSLFLAGVLYPYLYLSLRGSFSVQRKGVIEAAQLLGRGPTSVFLTVALPLARPALIAGLSLIMMEVVNEYGAVHFFSVQTLTVGILNSWSLLGDLQSAVRLAGGVLIVILIILYVEQRQRGRAKFSEGNGDTSPILHRKLNPLPATAALICCLIPLTIGFLYPVLRLAYWAVISWKSTNLDAMWSRVGNSFALAFITAFLLTGLAVGLVYAQRVNSSPFLRKSISFASIGYAIPGAVIAVGMMILTGYFRNYLPDALLAGSVWIIGFAYMVRFLAVPLHPVRASMERVCGSLDAASRLLGHSPLDTLFKINLPLIRGTLFSVTMLVFVDILKELPLTIILRPVHFETLSLYVFSKAKEGRIQECAVPSLMIISLAALGLFSLNRMMTSRKIL
jgi:iron(III) transport system permease protein